MPEDYVAKGFERSDRHRAPRGEVGGDERDSPEQDHDVRERERVGRLHAVEQAAERGPEGKGARRR